MHRGFWSILLTTLVLAGEVPAEDPEVWALAYFRQRYPTRIEVDASGKVVEVPLADPMSVEKLHLALSTDGRHWMPLAQNGPVWEQRLRDPFIRRAPDGVWHLVATGRAAGDPANRRGPVCLHATSRDLLTWDVVESLPLMEGVTDGGGRRPRNLWAPEWFLDPETGEFFLFWSSSFEDAGWKDSRLWFCRTRDWKTFTPAEVLFDPDYSVIDGTLREHEGRFHLFHKEEEFGERTGERRAIRLAVSKHLEGPYEGHEGPLNDGQLVPTITEGCAVMPDPKQPGWLLLYDYCMSNGYGVSSSPDLVEWTELEDTAFPADASHGSVFGLSAAEAGRLQERLGEASAAGEPGGPLEEVSSRGVSARDPSTIVRCGDEFWMFFTGRGVRSLRSKDLVTWEPGPRVFDRAPGWIADTVPKNRGTYWAPDVMKVGDRYLLYYSVSSFGAMDSAIGLATTPTLDPEDADFGWTDRGEVVRSRDGGDFNAIDPAVFQNDDGSLWLAFGSQWSGLKLTELDPATGLRRHPEKALTPLATGVPIEAAYIHKHGGNYYLFINRGSCCQGVRSTYHIQVGRSDHVLGPYLDRDGRALLDGGGTTVLETWVGPLAGAGHAGIVEKDGRLWFSCHFESDNRMDGKATFAVMPFAWSDDGWPEVAPPERVATE